MLLAILVLGYVGTRVLVTGGLGFIGSNLALRLALEGAIVTVIDPCVPGSGGDRDNIPRDSGIRILEVDIAHAHRLRAEISSADVVFNCAGEISHIDSMRNPERDLELNTRAQLCFLEALRDWRPGVRVVYASTRQVYGIPQYLPVDEKHPVHPVDYNGVHKYAAGQYHFMLTRKGELDAVVLRLTNVYGPRMSMKAMNQGFLSVFLKRMLDREPIRVYGDGMQRRDPLYVDDAVEAFLLAGLMTDPGDRLFNVGGGEVLTLGDIANIASEIADLPPPALVPFPSDRKSIDIGSYSTDSSRFEFATRWRPRVRFAEGLARTFAHYRVRQEAPV